MKVKAISFDFWNTLFTEQPGGFKLYTETRRRLLEDALASCATVSRERLDAACRAEAESHYRIWREEHRTLVASERIGKILTQLEVCLPDDVMRELVGAYEEGILARPPVLIPGVREAIDRLSARYRTGIISDVGFSPGRVLKQVLKNNDLLDKFDSLIFSDEAGCSKPHVEVFHRTARALGAAAGEIVHIGDLEFTDIVGAKNAGCHAIRFTGITPIEEDEETMADHVTNDFSEVPGIIESIDGG
jgi:putative hydrolase of the HAD superfamily